MLVDKTILKFINTGMAVQNILIKLLCFYYLQNTFQELSWVRVNSKELRIDKFQTCNHYYRRNDIPMIFAIPELHLQYIHRKVKSNYTCCEAHAKRIKAIAVPGPGNRHDTTTAKEMYVHACCMGGLSCMPIL